MRKAKHKAPQYELPFDSEPFKLVGDVAQASAPAPAPAVNQVDTKQGEMYKSELYADRLAPEYKVAKVRECSHNSTIDCPERIHEFWHAHIESSAWYRDNQECFVAIMLNVRRKAIGFHLVSLGTVDTCLADVRSVFGVPIMKSAAAIVLGHNHPSGEVTPSEADIKVTRDLARAGQLLKIEVLDHVIHGKATVDQAKPFCSLRELGYFNF